MLGKYSFGDAPPLLSVRQAADLMEVTEATVRSWISAGRLPAHRAGRAWLIDRDDLATMLDDGTDIE